MCKIPRIDWETFKNVLFCQLTTLNMRNMNLYRKRKRYTEWELICGRIHWVYFNSWRKSNNQRSDLHSVHIDACMHDMSHAVAQRILQTSDLMLLAGANKLATIYADHKPNFQPIHIRFTWKFPFQTNYKSGNMHR